jgi:lambda family phage portal protein
MKFWTATKRAASTFRAVMRGGAKRAFAMAQHNRLTANWSSFPVAPNREMRTQLRTMRSRSRNLGQNDDYIKRYLSLRENNIPGPTGFTFMVSLEPLSDKPSEEQQKHDAAVVKVIERGFEEWSHAENASASGKLSFIDQQRLLQRQMDRDGESLIRRIVGANNPFRYTLKIIDVAWLDEFYNAINPATGNRIVMSVEVDDDDRPVGYWLTMPTSEYAYTSPRFNRQRRRQFVPASEMIHAFVCKDDESQARGYPETHTAGLSLKVLDEADFAELVNAHVVACNLPYLIPPKDEAEQLPAPTDENDPSTKPIARPVEQQVQAGIQQILPPGWDVKEFKPEHPNPNWPEFAKAQLRRASAGLEMAYASLANDLSDANYSSLKAGRTEEQSTYRARQEWMKEHFNRIVGWEWLRMAIMAGQVKISLQDFLRVRLDWRGRGWPSIEPLKEIQATILAINNFLDDPIADAAERGQSFDDIVERLKKVKAMIEAAGLTILPVEPKPTVKTESDQEAAAGDNQDGKNNADGGTNRVLPELQHHLLPPSSRRNGRASHG